MPFTEFKACYLLRAPEFAGEESESKLLGAEEGFRYLLPAPAKDIKTGTPPRSREPVPHTYLWVIDSQGIPYVLNVPSLFLGDKVPKHTNLTGGAEAYVGGELWFATADSLYVSGGSGRYPPESPKQLEDACIVFRSFNYNVHSLGWDDGLHRAKRFLE